MNRPSQSLIVATVSRLLAQLIQIFALYVVFHGHYSPGGGFQGGALLAASILLLRMAEGDTRSQANFRSSLGTPLGALGVLLYAGVGLAVLIAGGSYLDYKFLPVPGMEDPHLRSLGILLVELGVALAVMATLISIFDDLAGARSE